VVTDAYVPLMAQWALDDDTDSEVGEQDVNVWYDAVDWFHDSDDDNACKNDVAKQIKMLQKC
jgi:hypothetical protein